MLDWLDAEERIDLAAYGSHTECRAAAELLWSQRSLVSRTLAEIDYCLGAARDWHGTAGESFRRFLGGVRDEGAELVDKFDLLARETERFAESLDRVASELATARYRAVAAGLRVEDEVIHTPKGTPDGPTLPGLPVAPSPDSSQIEVFLECRSLVAWARDIERQAHDALQDACARVHRAPLLEHWMGKVGLLPSDSGPAPGPLWGGNAAVFAAGVTADWATKVKFGQFSPVLNGLPLDPMSMSAGQRFLGSFRSANWRPLAGAELTHARWATAGKVVGVGGAVVTGGVAAFSQCGADADDPTVEDAERVARASTVGVTTGLGAYGGAVGGAQLGAAIGTAICPGVGTVVGGAVGGVLGGLGGAEFGQAVGETVMGTVGDVTDLAANGVEKIGEALGDTGGLVAKGWGKLF